ncbi:PREDICTED: uncharacterized protein LOC106323309 [Brassica oleracea var. oleracea]|uniref:uncharacterized protein LOC106323309 n=1 Tax=Brassica oleracea var. oleracea TaxID=109376 RepID=UPI0006A6C84D|nr:PREDICTED: uncharacterized protein LOC106323309 [Brassica oleracea var. oleracea]
MNNWNRNRIQLLLPDYATKILCIKLSLFKAPDKCVWLGTKSGDYTVKSGYYTAVVKIWHLAPLTSEVDYRGIIDLMSVWPSLCSQKCLPLTGILAGSLVPWILWAIWKAKNRFVFEGFYATPEDTLSSAIILAREWSNNCKPEPAVNKRSFRQIPEARSETMIVRSDAAWNSTSRKQG